MKTRLSTCASIAGFALLVNFAHAVPAELTYQGQLCTNGVWITSTQVFSFTMLTNSATAWQSGNTVTSFVEYGFFSVVLGDTSIMNALPPGIFDSSEDVYLRVQVAHLGSALTTLSPDKKIISASRGFDSDRLDGLVAAAYMRKFTNVVIVGPGGREGGADTNNLATAIAMAGGRATSTNPYTVLVLPGTYSGNCESTNNVDVVGICRDGCIVSATFTTRHDIMLQNLTFNVANNIYAIDVQTNMPYIDNIKINGGVYGINLASDAVIHNVEVLGSTNAAIRDTYGVTIDGLRVTGRAAFEVINCVENIEYKNIMAKDEPVALGIVRNSGGTIRSLLGSRVLNIESCSELRIRDLDIDCTSTGLTMRVGNVSKTFELFDGHLATVGADAVVISNTGTGKIRLNDVRAETTEGYNVITIMDAPEVSIKDSELSTGTNGGGQGIMCMTGDYLYVQTSWIRACDVGINLQAPTTELWLYDTTILTEPEPAGVSVAGAGPGATAPRIADCRLETDTTPTQGAGVPGWNAFGAAGAVGGQEDSNGNLVWPGGGRPVSP